MSDKACAIPGCPRPRKSRGWCNTHYQRWRTTGSVVLKTPMDRFMEKVEKRPDGCWIWTAYRNLSNYGCVTVDGVRHLAHRWIYEQVVGPIQADLPLDHLCHSLSIDSCPGGDTCEHRPCVNPDHLEPVTAAENFERGNHPWVAAHRAGTCLNGHEQTPEHLFVGSGMRLCLACHPLYDPSHRACKRCERARNSIRLATEGPKLKTHCINGHEFTPENTYLRPDNGTRQCRACGRERQREAS